MDCSTPGLLVHHQLLEFTQTHVHWIGDAIQPSHPRWSPSPPAFNLSSITVFSFSFFKFKFIYFNWRLITFASVLHIRWPTYWRFSFNISPSSEYPGLISFRIDWLELLAVQGFSRVFSNTTVQKHQFFSTQLSFWSNSHIHTWLLEKP